MKMHHKHNVHLIFGLFSCQNWSIVLHVGSVKPGTHFLGVQKHTESESD